MSFNSPHPIEIIGGGLAGLSLGLALRRAGVPVTLFEAGTYPRHRVCGEFITGLAPSTIERLGLAPLLADALRHREVAWFLGPELTRLQQLPEAALGLSRHALDLRLADDFVRTGGDLRTHTRVGEVAATPGRVFATGRRRARSDWLGLKVHVRDLELARELELHLGADAYVGLSRVENDTINVCGLFRRRPVTASVSEWAPSASTASNLPLLVAASVSERSTPAGPQLLLAYLSACNLTALADRLRAARIDAASFCAVAALSFDRSTGTSAASGIQLGDACAMIPPFTGNGMAMAFQSAEVALDPLLAFSRGETDWPTTCRATNAALRGRFRIRLASAHALHPFLLRPRRQRWLATLNRARLLPFTPLYAALH